MWVKLDDNFPDHPKVDQLSEGAFRLYISSLCYAQKYLTDGLIAYDRPPRLMARYRPKFLEELVDAGLWERSGPDYLIHDFTVFNHTRDYWVKKRARDAERLANWRAEQARLKEEGLL
jgi:hypothetical protein